MKEFEMKDLSKKGSNVANVVVGTIGLWVAMYSLVTLTTHSCVAETENGPYWKRQSVKLFGLLLGVVFCMACLRFGERSG